MAKPIDRFDTPTEALRQIRDRIIGEIQEHGIRETARLASVSRMRVQRFVTRSGADDSETLFILAAAMGLHFSLFRGPRHVNPIEAAASKYSTRRGAPGRQLSL